MAGLAVQVRDHPMFIAPLDRRQRERQEFATPKSAANQHGEHRVIPLLAKSARLRCFEQASALLDGQPVSHAHAKAAYTLDAPDTRSQLRTEQTRIGGLVGEATHGGQTEVDGCRRVDALFQMEAVAQNDGPVNASRGSEQYHRTNSSIAWSYVRWPLADDKLFRTVDLACSRSGRANTLFGVFFLRDFGIGDGLLRRRRQHLAGRHPSPLGRSRWRGGRYA